tara:strand:+ start:1721 stop:3139 length:1419 start_codon:yes stop_codon:yes gene_type:complete
MINSLRNFAKTKLAGLLVFIMIIPFVFWGMGSMFSSGNTNNVAKINNKNLSTQDFIDHINRTNIPQKTIKDNLDKNIIEELLSTLVSSTLLDLEIKNFEISISEETLSKKIKSNKNFLNENGIFERAKYEKFLLQNNQSAPGFETSLRARELQKNLFDYIGAGTKAPNFLIEKLFHEENRKIELEFINLNNFYKKKENFTDNDLNKFIEDNKEQLKVEYIDFDYVIINPKNLIGVDEFNQSFFDKIDEIEIDISNNVDLKTITSKFDIKTVNISNFKYSPKKNIIEKKIFEMRNIKFNIIEHENDYIIYHIKKSIDRSPDINDPELREEIIELVFQKSKFDYNKNLLDQIEANQFRDDNFIKMGKDNLESITLNSIKDNKKFDINAVELLYSLPAKTITLINDEENNIYLAKINKIQNLKDTLSEKNQKDYALKQSTNNKNTILKSYDVLLNKKYNVVINQKTIERVKNFFQ